MATLPNKAPAAAQGSSREISELTHSIVNARIRVVGSAASSRDGGFESQSAGSAGDCLVDQEFHLRRFDRRRRDLSRDGVDLFFQRLGKIGLNIGPNRFTVGDRLAALADPVAVLAGEKTGADGFQADIQNIDLLGEPHPVGVRGSHNRATLSHVIFTDFADQLLNVLQIATGKFLADGPG